MDFRAGRLKNSVETDLKKTKRRVTILLVITLVFVGIGVTGLISLVFYWNDIQSMFLDQFGDMFPF